MPLAQQFGNAVGNPGISLAQLEQIALQMNPTLCQAAMRIQAATGQFEQVGLYPNPVAGYTSEEMGTHGTAGKQGAFVSQEIVTAGKLKLNRAIVSQEVRQAEWAWQKQRQRVLTDVRRSFYEVLVAQRTMEITEQMDRIGEEGKGFRYLLDSLNPERVLFGIEAVGLGRDALRRASGYAKERHVFGRAIGQNQGIQHPLAENWTYLESAFWMCMRAAWLYDNTQPCGAEANAGKFLGARAAFEAATQSVLTHGGMGYAKEYQVERLFREAILTRIIPVTEQLILSFIGENVLDLPKSY